MIPKCSPSHPHTNFPRKHSVREYYTLVTVPKKHSDDSREVLPVRYHILWNVFIPLNLSVVTYSNALVHSAQSLSYISIISDIAMLGKKTTCRKSSYQY